MEEMKKTPMKENITHDRNKEIICVRPNRQNEASWSGTELQLTD